MNFVFYEELIAPCGMNCGVCIAYLREKKPCCGCRTRSDNKPKHCITCRIANCDNLTGIKSGFCYDCENFPCQRVKQLDSRYRKNYGTSLIGNLTQIQKNGIENFLEKETLKWICPSCKNVLSIHRDFCLSCKKNIRNL